jgi:hypothetical protein
MTHTIGNMRANSSVTAIAVTPVRQSSHRGKLPFHRAWLSDRSVRHGAGEMRYLRLEVVAMKRCRFTTASL